MIDKVYVRIRGKVQGPFTREQLRSLRDRGQFRRFHEVSADGKNWVSAASLRDLFPDTMKITQPLPATVAEARVPEPVAEAEVPRTVVEAQVPEIWGNLPAQNAGPRSGKGVLIGGVLLLGIVGLAVALSVNALGRREKKDLDVSPGTVTEDRDKQIITSPSAEKDIAGAVGLVVCGAKVVAADGTQYDLLTGQGSCFAISPDGHLLTNEHVIRETWKMKNAKLWLKKMRDEKLTEVQPTVWVFFGKEEHQAEIVHVSEEHDMSILKIQRQHAPFFKLGRSDALPRGKKVAAFGFPGVAQTPLSAEEVIKDELRKKTSTKVKAMFKPRDFEFVMTDGTISRVTSEDGKDRKWIQHNASINPGNSGGPLLDEHGVVLGINTLRPTEAQGVFYSLALQQLKQEVDAHARGVVWEE